MLVSFFFKLVMSWFFSIIVLENNLVFSFLSREFFSRRFWLERLYSFLILIIFWWFDVSLLKRFLSKVFFRIFAFNIFWALFLNLINFLLIRFKVEVLFCTLSVRCLRIIISWYCSSIRDRSMAFFFLLFLDRFFSLFKLFFMLFIF